MKKLFKLIIILVLLLNINTYAQTSIKNISIDGFDTVETNTEFYESFRVNFNELKKGTLDTLGLWIVAYELEYDENIFEITEIESDRVWDTTIYKDNNKIYVLSEFENDPYHNICADNVLYCADYLITIKFYVKDTNVEQTTIKMKDVGAGTFKLKGGMNPEYSTDELIELEYNSEATRNIKIKKTENKTEVQEPKSIITNNVPKTETPKTENKNIDNNNTQQETKSNNKYLKSIEIENYNINFSKDIKTYEIEIEKDINSLNIKALPEDDKSKIEIIGADKLKENNYKVLIKIKAENNEEDTYTINIKVKKNNNTINNKKKNKEKKLNFKLNKTDIILLIIAGVIILILIIIFIIINIKNNRDIDKKLDF